MDRGEGERVQKDSMDISDLSPEMRAKVESARESIRRHMMAIGPDADVAPIDNFAIGLDDNFNPFPASRKWAGNDSTGEDVNDK
ncbi:hypothetical protein LZ318_35390 [Saccharopolyspora indica]|uniref:hypothetical protein n=1 Tax=Saccharopolyspora indica TaxID=1229659 RepID=UPI0022EAE66B|nr:hypothetical protein [Saccharopolyspora indica]MDA3647244.1 hypothetical protein [Saccharopolyspora indica]